MLVRLPRSPSEHSHRAPTRFATWTCYRDRGCGTARPRWTRATTPFLEEPHIGGVVEALLMRLVV
jgi:hypothetical protein